MAAKAMKNARGVQKGWYCNRCGGPKLNTYVHYAGCDLMMGDCKGVYVDKGEDERNKISILPLPKAGYWDGEERRKLIRANNSNARLHADGWHNATVELEEGMKVKVMGTRALIGPETYVNSAYGGTILLGMVRAFRVKYLDGKKRPEHEVVPVGALRDMIAASNYTEDFNAKRQKPAKVKLSRPKLNKRPKLIKREPEREGRRPQLTRPRLERPRLKRD